MKVLITGAAGQLGWELQRSAPSGAVVLAVDVVQLDITDADAVSVMVKDETPDLIINCAAYTAVDKAEGNSILAYAINQHGAEHLAKAATINIFTDPDKNKEAPSAPQRPTRYA